MLIFAGGWGATKETAGRNKAHQPLAKWFEVSCSYNFIIFHVSISQIKLFVCYANKNTCLVVFWIARWSSGIWS